MSTAPTRDDDGSLTQGVVVLLAVGLALGLAYNAIGLSAKPAWGLSWVGVDRVAAMPRLADAAPATPAPAGRPISDDPMAPVAAAAGDVPVVPDLDRPIAVELDSVRRFVEQRAALVIDARESYEFAEGHIPGALNLPFDEVITDPDRLEAVDSGGLPYIIYCGGGTCEISLDLAHEMLALGKRRIMVYMGGFPEWESAGMPVAREAAS